MKPIFFSLFLASLLVFSCKEDDPVEPEGEKIVYYVKYEVETVSGDSLPGLEVSYRFERGGGSVTVPRNWEGVFGPFCRLDNLYLTVQIKGRGDSDYDGEAYKSVSFAGRISVGRPGHFFALKEFGTSDDGLLVLNYRVLESDVTDVPYYKE